MRILSLLALVFTLGLTACDSVDTDEPTNSITDLVVAEADLSILEQAVIAAGLNDDLDNEDSDTEFTVFAPTNAAFTAALEALDISAEELLARNDLGSILQLHVINSRDLEANDLQDGDELTTLNGQTLTVVVVGDRIGLDTEDSDLTPNAFITTADIRATNGIVHKIGGVLLPN